ncbi:MAG: hypothetical protein QM645_07210 [Asticcacaulis sp.]
MATITDSATVNLTVPTTAEIQEASEKFTHFWIGAFSPLWVPFFAATSVGLGSWALTSALAPARARDKEAFGALPRTFTDALSAQYGWLRSSQPSANLIEEAAEAVNDAAVTQARHIIESQDAIVDAVLTDDLLESPAIEDLNRKIETARAAKADVTPEVVPEVAPEVEAPVVSEAAIKAESVARATTAPAATPAPTAAARPSNGSRKTPRSPRS